MSPRAGGAILSGAMPPGPTGCRPSEIESGNGQERLPDNGLGLDGLPDKTSQQILAA